ncbi:adenine deaminase [Candidatus Protochlamydia phocaeensis]|uniref:adenine deaminase n=1 Tax=Candidatus Protochlamydia phocaeensis TaxID=1414722 RepID=UPI00083935BA|nr:adenine deaminase [Candidatus Protochlamydia phocaeensis]
MDTFTLSGQIVDIIEKRIYPGTITVSEGKITSINPDDRIQSRDYLLPGFIDAHIHIESSMLIPSEFARLATVHGTVATVSDPHEIANILGIEGIRYMIETGRQVPFHFYFGASPCFPATEFETSGATIEAKGIQQLFSDYHLHYLSEMMNYPGVLHRDPLVMEKIAIAKRYHKPIDGHAPGLKGEEAERYIQAGITTDHECFTLEEALDKIRYGMKIIIREGSAAKNYEALHPLLRSHPSQVMFCSDDKHPHELIEGHINQLVRRSIVEKGYDTMDVLRAACYHPVQHYQLESGLLRPGDSADFIVVDNLREFNVKSTYIKGRLVAQEGKTLIPRIPASIVNHFNCLAKKPSDFAIKGRPGKLRTIQVLDGQLITNQVLMDAKVEQDHLVADVKRDLLKIAVVNRYQEAKPAIGFINQFGLKEGAIASCIAHDSHNIICVGTNDEDMCAAVNALIEHKGGISVASRGQAYSLPLPIGGIMSADDGYKIADEYVILDRKAKELGTTLGAPFMTLSFMALLVIPSLKLSDKGLFDGSRFAFTDLNV